MDNFSIVSPSEFVSMPWKNGLGKTIEILKQDLPGEDRFAWRLSMADVTTDGIFSNFAGYDRTLLLLEGNGITLKHGNDQVDVLEAPLQAARFDGGTETEAVLHSGAIRDFNIMTLRKPLLCRRECQLSQ